MMGMEVVVVATDERGNVDIADLTQKRKMQRQSGPWWLHTLRHGVFEEGIRDICDFDSSTRRSSVYGWR